MLKIKYRPFPTLYLIALLTIAIGFVARAMTYNSIVYPRLHDQRDHSTMCNRCGTVFVE